MKGKLFSAVMLVIVLVTVVAMPASAGKPPSSTISVGAWLPSRIAVGTNSVTFAANNVTWSSGAPTSVKLFVITCSTTMCPYGVGPVATQTIDPAATTVSISKDVAGPYVRCTGTEKYTQVYVELWGSTMLATAYGPKYSVCN